MAIHLLAGPKPHSHSHCMTSQGHIQSVSLKSLMDTQVEEVNLNNPRNTTQFDMITMETDMGLDSDWTATCKEQENSRRTGLHTCVWVYVCVCVCVLGKDGHD